MRRVLFVLSLVAAPVCLRAQAVDAVVLPPSPATLPASLPASLPGTEKLAPEALREDFRIARHALEEGHAGIYRYTPKRVLDRIFDDAERAIDRPMDAYEFYRLLAPVIAAIKCGHTTVSLPEPVRRYLNTEAPLLPLRVKILGGRPYVFRDLTTREGDTSALVGREIRSVNGVPAAQLMSTMLAATSSDGDARSGREHRIGDFRFAQNLVMLLGLSAPYTVGVWDEHTRREELVVVDGMTLPNITATAQARYPEDEGPDRSADLSFLDDGAIAKMSIYAFGGFADRARRQDLRAFFQESFQAMHDRGTRALILDLRDNGGGEDALGKLLVSYLLDQPFQYYDDLVLNARWFDFFKYTRTFKDSLGARGLERRPDGTYRAVAHPNWGLQRTSTPTFDGALFVLIDGGSFSTTSEFLSVVRDRHRGVFIGEESGGGYYGNSSGVVPNVVLPNSNVAVKVPLLTYYMAVQRTAPTGHGVIPDYPVAHTIDDLLAGRDRDMALALGLARKAAQEHAAHQ
jgi:hypothetical protein